MSNRYNVDDILADVRIRKGGGSQNQSSVESRTSRKNLEERGEEFYKQRFASENLEEKPNYGQPSVPKSLDNKPQAPLFDEELDFDDVDFDFSNDGKSFSDIYNESIQAESSNNIQNRLETEPARQQEVEQDKFRFFGFEEENFEDSQPEPKVKAVKTSAEIFAEKTSTQRKPFTLSFDEKFDAEFEGNSFQTTGFTSLNVEDPEGFMGISDESSESGEEETTEQISHDIFAVKTGLVIRAMLTVILLGFSYYTTLSYTNTSPLPPFMFPEGDTMGMFIWVNVGMLIAVALINSNIVWNGIKNFLCLKANSDSLPALATMAALAQGVLYSAVPEAFNQEKIHLFFPVAILGLLFNTLGKILYIKRVENNFEIVASEGEKFTCENIADRDFIKTMCRGVEMENNCVVYGVKTNKLNDFLDLSFTTDQSDDFNRFVAPMCFFGAVAVTAITYIFSKSMFEAMGAFTIVMCLCSPFTSTLAAHFPLYKMSNRLTRSDAMVNGYSSVEELAQTDVIVVKANEIFKPKNVILHGIKPMDSSKIDDAIIDAASVLYKCDGILSEVFFQLVDRNMSVLRKVSNITYMDNLGLSAIVEGKKVLLGNGELMARCGVQAPSKETERRYVKDSRNIVYLAKSGELIAMFVISYKADKKVIETMNSLTDEGVSLVVYTMDPNITAEKIADVVDIPSDMIKIMPASLQSSYNNMIETKSSAPAHMCYKGGICSFCDCIRHSISVKSSVTLAIILQVIFIVLGYAVATLFSFIGWLPTIHFNYVIAYQVLVTLIVVLVSGSKSLR